MRIVNKKEFLALPNNTVYSKYSKTGNIEGLYIKTDTWENDWIYEDLISCIDCFDTGEFLDICTKAENDSKYEFKLDLYCGERDSLFDPNDLFMIYSNTEVQNLINKLKEVFLLFEKETINYDI